MQEQIDNVESVKRDLLRYDLRQLQFAVLKSSQKEFPTVNSVYDLGKLPIDDEIARHQKEKYSKINVDPNLVNWAFDLMNGSLN